MTNEEIDAMEAGRELDALIAERVMGWIWRACPNTFKPGRPWRRWLSEPDRNLPKWDGITEMPVDGLHEEESSVPDYSTDIGAAWLVVEKLTCTTKQWFHYEQSSTTYAATFEHDYDGEFTAEADTAPLAICRAALKTVPNCHEITTDSADEPTEKTG